MKKFTLSTVIAVFLISITAKSQILQADFPAASALATGAANNQDLVAIDADGDGKINGPTVSYIKTTVIEEAAIISGGGEGFSFLYNQNDPVLETQATNIPWNTKSRKSGNDMFGYCNLAVVTSYTDVMLLTPSCTLEAGKTYTFKQGMNNPNTSNGTAIFGIALMDGTPDNFDPANIGAELGTIDLNTEAKVDFTLDNITVTTDASYYFVIYLKEVSLNCTATPRFYATSLEENITTSITNHATAYPVVYPSPANEFITVSNTQGLIEIYNLTGNKVKSISNYNGGKINISSFKKGMYVIKTTDSAIKFAKE
ncbi:T9SS type A sorting domain-containing protein [Labilibacter sediminis]|nr:T9SS type A sorting domain-containing protein [Labilibacter sediminis]